MKWALVSNPDTAEVSHFLVLACMHGGCRIYELTIEDKDNCDDNCCTQAALLKSVEFTDTANAQHLAYGIDVLSSCTGSEGEKLFELASCSFYDNLVQIWSATL